jgi:hypothetical protein
MAVAANPLAVVGRSAAVGRSAVANPLAVVGRSAEAVGAAPKLAAA